MARRNTARPASPWTFDAPKPIDADDMRADGMIAVTEVFNDRNQAVRRARFLGWVVLPACPNSGKYGAVHPDCFESWAQKTRSETRRLRKISKAQGVPWSPVAYGF